MSAFDDNALVTISLTLPASKLMAVYALLGGTALASGNVASAKPGIIAASAASEDTVGHTHAGSGETAQPTASPSNDEGAPDVDAHGWPWDANLHATTKGTTKEGLWRMKPGATRPDPKPGFPLAGSATSTEATATTEVANGAAAPIETASEDDEFAAFRDAANAIGTVEVPARKWSDADLGALCNQAATKLGDPTKVKAVIAEFVPAGEVSHSRNIPAEKREEFAKAVEKAADITFAG